jgi:hypothetical protein
MRIIISFWWRWIRSPPQRKNRLTRIKAYAATFAVLGVALLFSVQVAHAATVVQLQSDPGDIALGGQSTSLTPSDATSITVNVATDSTITLDVVNSATRFSLHLTLVPRPGEALVGSPHVMPVNPQGTMYSVVSLSAGDVCFTDEGMFVVYEVVGTPGAISQLAFDFQQRCQGATGLLHGQVRFNSAVPLTQPAPLAVIDALDYVDEGDAVTLNGAWSLPGTSAVATYAWTQISGPAVMLSSNDAAAPSFTAVAVPGAISPLVFALTVSDGQGNTSFTQHTVNVYSRTTPRTVMAFESDPGEYVFGGKSYKFRDTDSTVSTQFSTASSLQVTIGSTVLIQVESPLGAPLQPGNYLGAHRSVSNIASLDIEGFSRGCNDSLGQFSIYEIQFDTVTNQLTKLAMDFDRACTSNPDTPARAYGQIRINSSVPLIRAVPNAIAGDSQEVAEQSSVQLDGSSSRAGANPITTYLWTQLSGPPVTLSSVSVVSPTFVAPDVPTGSVQLVFSLTVSDAFGNSATDQVQVNVVSASALRNLLAIDSSPGDFIGQGENLTLDENTSLMTVTQADPTSVAIDVVPNEVGLGMIFNAPAGQTLAVGNYEGAQRAGFAAPVRPGLDIGALGRGCNTLTGRFVVREIAFDASGQLSRFAADATQYCEGLPEALNIAVRYNSSVPLVTAAPTAAAGSDQDVLERATVTLDGTHTLPGTGKITAWQWTQTAGPAVSLMNSTSPTATFRAPTVSASGATLSFQLLASSDNGTQSTDRVDIRVHSKAGPQTFASLVSSVGDYIGAGQSYLLSPADGAFSAPSLGSMGEAAHVLFDGGPERWEFDFANNVGTPLAVGSYSVTVTSLPGMGVSHDGSGCDQTHGTLQILDIAFANDVLQRLAVDFVQYCDSSTGPLTGQLRYNVVLPDANAGGDQTASAGSNVTLSGMASVATVGTLQGYSWVQASGPTASISNANTASASIVVPALTAGATSASLVFQLTVKDDRGLTNTDSMTLTVTPGSTSTAAGGGGSLSWWDLLGLFMVIAARRTKSDVT